MLGSTRPEVRDGTAFPALATWIDRGVYDDLLAGLGDGMVAGLSVGLGETGHRHGLPAQLQRPDPGRVPRARQRAAPAARRQDPRVGRPGRDLVPRRARHPRLGARQGLGPRGRARRGRDRRPRRVTAPGRPRARRCCSTSSPSGCSSSPPTSPSRPASPTGSPPPPCRSCVATPSAPTSSSRGCTASAPPATPSRARSTTTPTPRPPAPQAFLRALFVQLSLAPEPPTVRPDLLLVVIEALRMTNAPYLRVADR